MTKKAPTKPPELEDILGAIVALSDWQKQLATTALTTWQAGKRPAKQAQRAVDRRRRRT
ncbi:MAG: hypothetical protein ACYS8X_09965 [Planctomycetota bacterium]